MNATSSTLLTVGVPLFIVWLTVKAAPDFVGKLLLKPFDYASEARLARLRDQLGRETAERMEALKADLQATYSTLQTAVDVVAAGQSGMRDQIIAATTALWKSILEHNDKVGGLVTFTMIFTADEIDSFIKKGAAGAISGYLSHYKTDIYTNEFAHESHKQGLERHRLFCGDRLWLIFFVGRAVYLRNALLMVNSFKTNSYHDWRDDEAIVTHLSSILPSAIVERSRSDFSFGLQGAMNLLQSEFVREAHRVMSGSKAFADSLTDTNALMQLEQQKAAEARGFPQSGATTPPGS